MKALLLTAMTAVETTAAAAESGIKIAISPDAFLKTLPMMGKGMLGILIVIAVIMLVIFAFNRIFKPKKDDGAK